MAPTIEFVAGSWHVTLSTHALCVVVAVVVGTLVALRRAREPMVVLAWAPALAGAALIGSHLLYTAVHGGSFMWWSGGLSSMGGVAAVAVVLGLAARGSARRLADLADAVAPAGILALGIGRLGCFLAGCCWGRPTDLPWGVVFPELGPPPRHPLQLYSAFLDLLLGVALLRPAEPPGITAARTASALGTLRLLLETLRDPAAADQLCCGVRVAHLGAVILVAGGVASAVRFRRIYRLYAAGVGEAPSQGLRGERLRSSR